MENITKSELVDLGYPTKEPSIQYMVFQYYREHFDFKHAELLAKKYCEQFEQALKSKWYAWSNSIPHSTLAHHKGYFMRHISTLSTGKAFAVLFVVFFVIVPILGFLSWVVTISHYLQYNLVSFNFNR